VQVEGIFHFVRRFNPGREILFEQIGEIGTRHDDAFIDIKAEFAQPRLARQVGRRQALGDALLENVVHSQAFGVRQPAIDKRLQPVVRQVQGVQDQPGRLVVGVVAAMAEEQVGFVEAADGVTQPVAQGDEFVEKMVFDHGWFARSDCRVRRRSSTPS